MAMVADTGSRAVIIGHSERRQYFAESDASVNRRVKAALAAKLTPIVCVGESLAEREANHTESVLKRQFEGSLHALTPADFSRILLAYEPVWAIGRGVHIVTVNDYLARRDAEWMGRIYTFLGLSVGVVGGASLDAKSFAAIVNF